MSKKVGEGLVGSQFILSIHAESLKTVSDAEIIALMSPTKGNAKKFASKHDIPHHFTKLDEMLDIKEIDMIVIGTPNSVHCEIALKAAKAGKPIVVEKPLCMNLAEADLNSA